MFADLYPNLGREDRLGPPSVVAISRPRHERVARASSLCRKGKMPVLVCAAKRLCILLIDRIKNDIPIN